MEGVEISSNEIVGPFCDAAVFLERCFNTDFFKNTLRDSVWTNPPVERRHAVAAQGCGRLHIYDNDFFSFHKVIADGPEPMYAEGTHGSVVCMTWPSNVPGM